MPTNLNLNDELVQQAVQLGQHKTKREAVNAALAEYVAHHQRLQALSHFGSFDFDESYDYKKDRSAR